MTSQPLDPRVPIVLYVDAAEPGGTAGYAVGLGRGLRRLGYRVAAICSGSERVAPMRQQLAAEGVEVHALEDYNLSPIGRARRLGSFVSIIRRYPGCVLGLLLGNFVAGGPVILAGVLGGAGAIVRADLQPSMPPYRWWRHKGAIKLKDQFVQRIVVGALENIDTFVHDTGRGRKRFEVIHTGIDLRKFDPRIVPPADLRRELGYARGTLLVGTISRLDEERKGIAYFVDMAASVARAVPHAAFVVAGDGSLRPALEQQASQLGLDGRISFIGWRSDIPALLGGLDVFVMPSTFEGGPTSVLEAMAMGIPVVATRVGMVPEVVADGKTGFIVEPADAPGLADAVSRLLADQELRTDMGRRAGQKAAASFSIERMVDRYVEVFAGARAGAGAL